MYLTTTYSRRDLLKLGAAGALALGLAGTPLALKNIPAPSRVGVILPETRLYPQLGANLLAGLRAGLTERSSPIRLLTSTALTPTAAMAELLAAGADIVVAATSPTQARPLHEQAQSAGRELIVVGAGEALPEPGLHYVGLGYWQASWAAGKQAVHQFGPHIATIASAYESGFDSFYAFQLGVEAAGGRLDTPLLVGTGLLSVQEAMHVAAAQRPDALYIAADYATSREISTAAGATPVVVGGFSTLGGPLRAYHAASWAAAPRPEDPFVLLGRDVAALLQTGALPQHLHRPLLWQTPTGGATLLETVPEAAICTACAAVGPRARWTNAYLSV